MVEVEKLTTDVSPEVLYLGKLLDRLAEGWIRVPRFQRPFIWRPNQMCDLLDSVRRRYPIGSVLIWETDLPVESHDSVGPIQVDQRSGRAGYVVDGQQRLISLLGSLRLPADSKAEWRWRIFFDLEQSIFYQPRNYAPKPHDFPVRALLGTFDFLAECQRLIEGYGRGDRERARPLLEKAERVADIFRNYQIPLIRITEADLPAAVRIFARLNTRGRRMTPDHMVSALTYREGSDSFDLSTEIDRVLEGLADYGFGGLDRMAVLRAVLAAAERDIYDTDWTNVVEDGGPGTDLRQPLRDCEEALGRAVDFLHREGVTSDRLLPYALQIVLLSEFFRNCSDPAAEVLEELRHWFWVTSFIGWFATFNSSQARAAIEEMRELARGERLRLESVKQQPALPFPSRFDGRSARVRAFLLYLLSLDPKSLDDWSPLNGGEALSAMGPQALRYLQARRLPEDLHSSPANRILLGPAYRGQAKKALLAVPAEQRAEIFASHGIPEAAIPLLDRGDISGFLRARLECLIEGERDFMQARRVRLPVGREPAEPDIDTDDDED